MIGVTSRSTVQTGALAELLAAVLQEGDIVLLDGVVGAGKTTFAQALGRALGVSEPVRSPTYTVAHDYALPGGRMAHIDLYRSPVVDEIAWADLEPHLEARYTLIEWPSAARAHLHAPCWELTLERFDTQRLVWLHHEDSARRRRFADALLDAVPW